MIKVELLLDELDYNALIDRFLPVIAEKLRESGNPVGMLLSNGMPASMAKSIVSGLPQNTKEKLLADLLQANAPQLKAQLEQFAAGQGVAVTVRALQAEVQKDGD